MGMPGEETYEDYGLAENATVTYVAGSGLLLEHRMANHT